MNIDAKYEFMFELISNVLFSIQTEAGERLFKNDELVFESSEEIYKTLNQHFLIQRLPNFDV